MLWIRSSPRLLYPGVLGDFVPGSDGILPFQAVLNSTYRLYWYMISNITESVTTVRPFALTTEL